MDIQTNLEQLGLDETNSVVIGSGILSALGIRPSNDIDVVVRRETYTGLAALNRFTAAESHGRDILHDDTFEIGTSWGVLGSNQTFEDLVGHSEVINGVRYVSLEFLLKVKESWLQDEDVRPKDIADVKLIRAYLA